jgi:hypothetical protein
MLAALRDGAKELERVSTSLSSAREATRVELAAARDAVMQASEGSQA